MLISCPECNHDVSDKAVFCPCCGYPFQTSPSVTYKRKTKRRRLPNGFGQISEIKNQNLSKPFRAMITVGKDANGRPICKTLKPVAYFETYNEAYTALLEYNQNPATAIKAMTVGEVYEKWSEIAFTENPKRERNYSQTWKRVSIVKDMKMSDVRVMHIKHTMEYNNPGNATIRDIKVLWNQLFKYALEYEIVEKNYAQICTIPDHLKYRTSDTAHTAFTEEELNKLVNSPDIFSKIILFACYTGFRPKEICEIRKENVDFDNWIIVGGMKTAAGTDRPVPVHPAIRDIVTMAFDTSETAYLFGHKGLPYKYTVFNKHFHRCIEASGIEAKHTPHDCRKHFITMAKKYGVNDYAVKRIVGHSIADLTERVYTERDSQWLMSEIQKIPTSLIHV